MSDNIKQLAAARPRERSSTPGSAPECSVVPLHRCFTVYGPVKSRRPDPVEMLRQRARRSTLERIADALGSHAAFLIYVGFIVGCFVTVGAAALWAQF
jgi:hypothetical protein